LQADVKLCFLHERTSIYTAFENKQSRASADKSKGKKKEEGHTK
jgi:hypothetical protein